MQYYLVLLDETFGKGRLDEAFLEGLKSMKSAKLFDTKSDSRQGHNLIDLRFPAMKSIVETFKKSFQY